MAQREHEENPPSKSLLESLAGKTDIYVVWHREMLRSVPSQEEYKGDIQGKSKVGQRAKVRRGWQEGVLLTNITTEAMSLKADHSFRDPGGLGCLAPQVKERGKQGLGRGLAQL